MMKKAWLDLKSFITVSMIIILLILVVGGLCGCKIQEDMLVLVTNLMTAVFTYYFTRKDNNYLDDIENRTQKRKKDSEREDKN